MPSVAYVQRSEWNVRDSDAAVLLSIAPTLSDGSKKTMEFAREYNKPRLDLHPEIENPADKLRTFLKANSVEVLNVAGPRAIKERGVGEFVMRTLDKAFTDIGGRRGGHRQQSERPGGKRQLKPRHSRGAQQMTW